MTQGLTHQPMTITWTCTAMLPHHSLKSPPSFGRATLRSASCAPIASGVCMRCWTWEKQSVQLTFCVQFESVVVQSHCPFPAHAQIATVPAPYRALNMHL